VAAGGGRNLAQQLSGVAALLAAGGEVRLHRSALPFSD